MTTRKNLCGLAGLSVALAFLSGCATPGPLHVYSLGTGGERSVHDTGAGRTAEVPSFLADDDQVIGFAYDPFTDHFFLRLAPGNKIRVVDRPARAIKREFTIDGATTRALADLAARPRDGHLFFLEPGTSNVLVTSRLGKTLRTLALADAPRAPIGLALDTASDRLLVLGGDGRQITHHDQSGARTGTLTLEQAAGPSLAFDAEQREIYAPLRDRAGEIGVFDETGKLLRTSPARGAFVDVGVRSFVRVF